MNLDLIQSQQITCHEMLKSGEFYSWKHYPLPYANIAMGQFAGVLNYGQVRASFTLKRNIYPIVSFGL